MTELERLARRLHKWPDTAQEAVETLNSSGWYWRGDYITSGGSGPFGMIERKAWHAERQRLGLATSDAEVPAADSEQYPDHDPVEKPAHYQIMPGVEFIDVRQGLLAQIPPGTPYGEVDDWSRCFEYIGRMWGKNGLEDAKKGRVYLNWLIEKMEARQ